MWLATRSGTSWGWADGEAGDLLGDGVMDIQVPGPGDAIGASAGQGAADGIGGKTELWVPPHWNKLPSC
jgi:hypothetical protein